MNAFRYGNPSIDCDGAQMRAVCRQLATVVTITGDLDGGNVDRISAHAKRFALSEKPLVLDLSGVSSFAAQGLSLLHSADDACEAAGVEWILIASQPVSRVLRLHGYENTVPTAQSVAEALHHFSDVMSERRRLLPLLTKSA